MHNNYLLVLFGYLLLLLPLFPSVVVIHLGLLEAGDEVVENAEEFVALRRHGVLAEEAAHPVKLTTEMQSE